MTQRSPARDCRSSTASTTLAAVLAVLSARCNAPTRSLDMNDGPDAGAVSGDAGMTRPLGCGWISIPVSGDAPMNARIDGLAFDGAHARIVTVSGLFAPQGFIANSVQSISPAAPSWTQIATTGTGPTHEYLGPTVEDASGGRLLVFGGWSSSSYRMDVWALDLARDDWTLLLDDSMSSPEGGASVVFDAQAQRIFTFGGMVANQDTSAVFAFSLSDRAWSQITTTGTSPSPRENATLVLDHARNRVIVFGGDSLGDKNKGPLDPTSGVFALSLGADVPTWTELAPSGAPPDAVRYGFEDRDGARIVFVASDGTLHGLSLGDSPSWSTINPANPPPLADVWRHAFDDAHRTLYALGYNMEDCSGCSTPACNAYFSELDLTGCP
jgi:hypothetical protein